MAALLGIMLVTSNCHAFVQVQCSVDATGIDLIKPNDRFVICGVLSLSTRMLMGRFRDWCFFEACLACRCSHVCTVRKPSFDRQYYQH